MDLQSIHTLAIRACLLSLLSPSLCLWAQQTSSTLSLDELISQIATAEKKLVNVKLECEASEEERVLPTDPWKPTGVTVSCTAWFNGLPKSKGRVDVHQETLRHEQGGFLQRSFSASFDGQTGRMVRHAAGAPGAMVEEKRAEILPSAPYNVASDYVALTTGTAFCLSFWAKDQKITLSAWLKSVKAAGRVKLSVVREQYQGVDCVRISVGEPNSGGTYWLDTEHGLAFRGYESATVRKGHRWVSKREVVTEIVEAAPGVWYPQRAFQESQIVDPNRSREIRILFHASKVIANDPVFDEGVFRAPIPSGYIVTDKILGTRYRMGLDDRALDSKGR
jgi:hypothetical protein